MLSVVPFRVVPLTAMLCLVAGTGASTQPSADAARAAGITVMRAINTAENAARRSSGKYLELTALLDHPAMARVRIDISVNNGLIAHRGQQLRLALTPDALHYQAMVVPAETCGTAVFSDERGLIYTGKVLDC